MADTDQNWLRWVTFTDQGDTLGSKLFGGSPIYAYVNSFGIAGKTNYGYTPKTMPGTDYIGSNIGSSYHDSVTYNSFTGFENPGLKCSGNWTTQTGSYRDTGEAILTPYKIFIMATSGRRFYVRDERLIEQMIIESGSNIYSTLGIPVVITDWNMDASMTSLNAITWSLTLREDKV